MVEIWRVSSLMCPFLVIVINICIHLNGSKHTPLLTPIQMVTPNEETIILGDKSSTDLQVGNQEQLNDERSLKIVGRDTLAMTKIAYCLKITPLCILPEAYVIFIVLYFTIGFTLY